MSEDVSKLEAKIVIVQINEAKVTEGSSFIDDLGI